VLKDIRRQADRAVERFQPAAVRMKFHWLHTMPWPDLPDDFAEKHRSVWVDIDYDLYDPVRGNALYHEYLDELEFAEVCGFDGVGVNEHHANAHGLMPSPNLMAATLARRTSRAAILLMGNSIALYNPPLRVAEELAMLDVLSGGRLIAGFPVGTPMDAAYAYGVPPAQLRERYTEAHDLIVQAWTNRRVFSFNGRYTKLRYVNPWPRPLQQPHPPIWIPGGGSPETFAFCAEKGYLYSYLSTSGYLRARMVMDGFWRTMHEHSVEINPYQAAVAQTVCVAETDVEAKALYARHIEYNWRRSLHVYPGFADAPGYRTEQSIRSESAGRRPASDQTWESLVESGAVIAGSPATVERAGRDAARWPPAGDGADGLDAARPDRLQHAPLRRAGDALPAGEVRRVRRSLVAAAAATGAAGGTTGNAERRSPAGRRPGEVAPNCSTTVCVKRPSPRIGRGVGGEGRNVMGVRSLEQAEIERVLDEERVVRIAFDAAGERYVVPVFFVWYEAALHGVTTAGRKTRLGGENGAVAFQVDSSARTGVWEWFSVSGEGQFELLRDQALTEAFVPRLQKKLADAPPWAVFSKPNLLELLPSTGLHPWRIRPTRLSGRERSA
jgi:alkanesulfonate monooxygenase SsuD/methylene tetrahydromethanopterin reductase-like flavin-dependent oxidoreductase (luciferase family)/nitroimidazol reductase NimA-like FMN-containing flavoprotein (pyridoxamine 5'-phosphate oxidase superfamily)